VSFFPIFDESVGFSSLHIASVRIVRYCRFPIANRHLKIFTLEVYTRAKARAKRVAQQRIVKMMLPEEGLASDIRLQRRQPDELLGAGD
jgi:hypothetical protein